MQAVTTTHVRRWRLNRQSVGEGHLYQGTYKSFPVQDDDHFYTVCRYVERNALRANLAERAEDWRCGSLWQRRQRTLPEDYPPLSDWPHSMFRRVSSWPRNIEWIDNGYAIVVLALVEILAQERDAAAQFCRCDDQRVPVAKLKTLVEINGES